jgi:hypothetical protein
MDHAHRAEPDLVGVAARAEVLRAQVSAARFGGLRRLRYSARRTMFSINDPVRSNLILFMRRGSEAAYILCKPKKHDKL